MKNLNQQQSAHNHKQHRTNPANASINVQQEPAYNMHVSDVAQLTT